MYKYLIKLDTVKMHWNFHLNLPNLMCRNSTAQRRGVAEFYVKNLPDMQDIWLITRELGTYGL